MVTTTAPSPSPEEKIGQEDAGFFNQLIKSILEPGVNPAAVLAMNVSFFLLILVLFGLAALTQWNGHVLLLLGISTVLWASMVWFVMEITKLQTRPDNMPVLDSNLDGQTGAPSQEEKKDQ